MNANTVAAVELAWTLWWGFFLPYAVLPYCLYVAGRWVLRYRDALSFTDAFVPSVSVDVSLLRMREVSRVVARGGRVGPVAEVLPFVPRLGRVLAEAAA